jgi:hypothetical protein
MAWPAAQLFRAAAQAQLGRASDLIAARRCGQLTALPATSCTQYFASYRLFRSAVSGGFGWTPQSEAAWTRSIEKPSTDQVRFLPLRGRFPRYSFTKYFLSSFSIFTA